MPLDLQDKLYTSTEVAEILGVSLRSVYRYIEEDKLDAEVKTATGRHRFTKQNIVDFLYPKGEKATKEKPSVKEEPKKKTETKKETAEEPIDWLAKFREAAKKFDEERQAAQKETAPAQKEEPVLEPKKEAKETAEKFEGLASFVEPESAKPLQTRQFFYRSRLGGLKDIAQNIDKNAKGSSVDYAFTLNSGLSLFRPIKPFSTLHVYIRSNDQEFYERILMLVPSDEANAQLCLMVSDDDKIYEKSAEMHGLRVVAKERLFEDVKQYGDIALKSEAEAVLK